MKKIKISLAIFLSIFVIHCLLIIFLRNFLLIGDITINEINCSFMSYEKAINTLNTNVNEEVYIFHENFYGNYKVANLSLKQIASCTYDMEDIYKKEKETPLLRKIFWFAFREKYSVPLNIDVNKNKLSKKLEKYNGNNEPKDAYITYDYETSLFTIIPEEYGDIFDVDVATKIISNSIKNGKTEIDISDAFYKPTILYYDDELMYMVEELNELFEYGNIPIELN